MSLYNKSVISYCERVGDGLLSEPINLVTNLSLLLAAYICYHQLKSRNRFKTRHLVLVSLAAAIGFGSALWHSFRTPWSHTLDFVPIYLFFIFFLYFFLETLLKKSNLSGWLTAAYVAFQVLLSYLFPQLLNGSVRHVSNLGFIIMVLWYLYKRTGKTAYPLLFALGSYAIGITFRSIDNVVCSWFPLGTHFLWHGAAGLAIYFAINSLTWLEDTMEEYG